MSTPGLVYTIPVSEGSQNTVNRAHEHNERKIIEHLAAYASRALLMACSILRSRQPQHCLLTMVKKRGSKDYPVIVKQKVCDCVYYCCSEDERAAALINRQLPVRRGRPSGSEPDVMTRAFSALAQSVFKRDEDKATAMALTRKKFYQIAKAYFPDYLASGELRRRVRTKRPQELSQAQCELAARILGSPVWQDGRLKFHRTPVEAATSSRTFLRLSIASGMPLVRFAAYLCETCPDIVKKGRVDMVEELCASTLEARREASDVWGGRSVWRYSQTPGPRGGGLNSQGLRPVYWLYGSGPSKWPFYRSFTFMLDAATMSSGDKMHELWRETAFQRTDVTCAPEVVTARDPVGSQVWTMFYVVVHPDFGLVSGPDFMYWGSKTVRGQTKHADAFQCW